MLYDCGWNLSEVSRRPPAPADVIHSSYSGNRLAWINMRNGCCSDCHASCQCRFLTGLTSWSAKLPDAANLGRSGTRISCLVFGEWDFVGPYAGGKHQIMPKGMQTIRVPNPHKGGITGYAWCQDGC